MSAPAASPQLTWFTRAPLAMRRQAVTFRNQIKEVEILDYLGGDNGHYTGSFGTQWTKYRNVQIDRLNGTQASYRHLQMFVQGNLDVLKGQTVLEIGSGAGRFTDYLVDIAGQVLTVDPSAIYANVALGAANLIAVRADLFDVPVRREKIDVVFCRGVTQHTFDSQKAIMRLFDYVKPGGIVLFDIYALKWFTPLCTKYWLRPFTRRLPPEQFITWAERWVPRLLKFKRAVVEKILPRNKLGINIANQLVPVADFTHADELRNWERQIEWSILDTVDMYTPRYDRPMTWTAIMRTLREVGAEDIHDDRTSFCFRARARR
jgi:SAM-dependent methyltransferase